MEECDFSTVKPSLQERLDELIASGNDNAIAQFITFAENRLDDTQNLRQQWRSLEQIKNIRKEGSGSWNHRDWWSGKKFVNR